LLLIVTLSLAGFTASMAKSLDTNLLERNHYIAGSDVMLFDMGQDTGSSGPSAPGSIESAMVANPDDNKLTGPKYFFLPVTDYMSIPRVWPTPRCVS
jgi:putative ABC transport system permease protein